MRVPKSLMSGKGACAEEGGGVWPAKDIWAIPSTSPPLVLSPRYGEESRVWRSPMNPRNPPHARGARPDLTMDLFAVTNALFAALQPPLPEALRVTRDHEYGPDERQRLDIFAMPGLTKAPVLVFVPGGGFVRGDKRSPTPPFTTISAASRRGTG